MKVNKMHVKHITALLLGLCVALNVNAGLPAPEPEEDDLLLQVVPVIAAGTEDPLPPQWGVAIANVCCPSSSATYTVTIDNQRRSSTNPACNVGGNPTFSGFQVSTEGNKSFSSALTSATCPTLSIPGSLTFDNDTAYIFELGFEDGVGVVLNVFFGPIPESSIAAKIDNKSVKSMQKAGSYILSGESEGWSKMESDK